MDNWLVANYIIEYGIPIRVGQSVESALIALAAIFFWLIAHILTIFDKKYRILTRRDKKESYLIVLQQNNV